MEITSYLIAELPSQPNEIVLNLLDFTGNYDEYKYTNYT